jgi:hypothetical protein
MQASGMPSYKADSGAIEECLGRLVWSADRGLSWPLRYDRDQSSPFSHRFSENVFSRGDEIRFGKTRIRVNALEKGIKDAVLASLPAKRISALKKELAWAEANLQKKLKLKNGNVRERNQYEIARSDVESTKRSIDEISAKYELYDPGLTDSYGYWTTEEEASGNGDRYSIYRAYLFTTGYLYTFESRETLGPTMSMETHRKQFSALLTSFRPRRMNEIPADLGVCIPFGFLPDDGRTVTDIKQSLPSQKMMPLAAARLAVQFHHGRPSLCLQNQR